MRYALLALVLALGGCGGPVMTCPDGIEPIDGMCPDRMDDAGPPPMDGGGSRTDAGMEDAEAPEMDAGRADAGPLVDAGPLDAGPLPIDAGPPDAGPPDAGMCEPRRFYADGDRDGFGDPAISVELCSAPPGFVTDSTDCDDGCASCHPGSAEVCDGEDNDCDASADEGVRTTFYRDADRDGYGVSADSTSACTAPSGYVATSGDCDDACAACFPGNPELCDGEDNDCDASADEGVTTTYYRDADGDGYGIPGETRTACAPPAGYVAMSGDCNDGAMDIRPGAAETCNAIDDNCSGAPDESFACVLGTPVSCTTSCGSTGTALCSASCTIPSGAACSVPAETCNGADDDCDGIADERLFTLGPPRVDSYPADFARPEVVTTGTHIISFWQAAGTVSAWRHTRDGAPTTTAQVPLGGTSSYDADSSASGAVVWAYIDASGHVVVQRLDPTSLAPQWTRTITVDATHVQVAAGSTHVYVFTVESGNVYRRRITIGLGGVTAGTELVGTTSGAIALADDGIDRQLAVFRGSLALQDLSIVLMQGSTTSSVVSTRRHPAPNAVSSIAVASPWSPSSNPDVVVAYSTFGASVGTYNTRYVSYRAGFTTVSGLIVAGTAASGAPPDRHRIDLEYADNTYVLAGAITSVFPVATAGTPVVAQLDTRTTSAGLDVRVLTSSLGSAVHESLGVVRFPDSVAFSDRLFYNPSGGGIASIPIGCF